MKVGSEIHIFYKGRFFLLYNSHLGWIFCLVYVNGLYNVDIMGFSMLMKWLILIAIRAVTQNRY